MIHVTFRQRALGDRGLPQQQVADQRIGSEPFDPELTGSFLHQVSRRRKTSIKQFVMDSRIVVGVGNIYASESFFALESGRVGRRVGVTLSQYEGLLDTIRQVLSEAIEAGGTTLRDYSRVTGEPGYFEQSLDVYEAAGRPCVNCMTPIRRKVIGQRASIIVRDARADIEGRKPRLSKTEAIGN